jgi:hypothetical protein
MFLVLSLLISAVAYADVYRYPVQTIKPLLLDAIKSGEGHGILVGQLADKMHEWFKSPDPILVDVKAISSLPQKGCKRLLVSVKQDNVIDKGQTTPQSKQTSYHVEFCDNGDFPLDQGEVRIP